LHFGIGATTILIPDGSSRSLVGSAFGIATLGNSNNNFTIGAGFAFGAGDISESPAIQLGGMIRLGQRIMIVTDHVIFIESRNTTVGGSWALRYITPKISVDIGLATPYESFAAPILGVAIKF